MEDAVAASASTEVADLAARRAALAAAGAYRSAHRAAAELAAAKARQEATALRELEARQQKEMHTAEESFAAAHARGVEDWRAAQQQLAAALDDDMAALLARQRQDEAALRVAQAERASLQRPKFSPALLNLRHVERTLAAQGDFIKADKVKHQADALEMLELGQTASQTAARDAAERERLHARQERNRDAAATKAAGVAAAADARRRQALAQLSRRHLAVRLSLSRAHAAQRLALQNELRGALGLARPSKLLDLPSFGRSLADTPLPATDALALRRDHGVGGRCHAADELLLRGSFESSGVPAPKSSACGLQRHQEQRRRALHQDPQLEQQQRQQPRQQPRGQQQLQQHQHQQQQHQQQQQQQQRRRRGARAAQSPLAAAAAAVAADPGVQRFRAAATEGVRAVHRQPGDLAGGRRRCSSTPPVLDTSAGRRVTAPDLHGCSRPRSSSCAAHARTCTLPAAGVGSAASL